MKKKLQIAGILTGIGAVVGAVTPLVIALKSDENQIKSDEKELHKDEALIDSLNSKILEVNSLILGQANITASSIDNIKEIILDIYKEIYKLSDKTTAAGGRVSMVDSAITVLDQKLSGLERAINMLIRSNHGHN